MIPSAPFYFMGTEPLFSVIVPFFDEKENVAPFCLELRAILQSMSQGGEVILIDDGSTDGTAEVMDRLAASWPQWRVYHLPENQGQSAALLFGFSKALAPIIVTMDGDGQNDPRDIPRLLARLKDADMVVGRRIARQDSWTRRKISRVANLVRAHWLGDGVSDAGCALKAFRREVTSAFIPIRTLYSFMPALAVAAGLRVVEEPVNHRPRGHGQSKYSVKSFLLLPIIDFIGLNWFKSRRCPRKSEPDSPLAKKATDRFYQRALIRWLAAILLGATLAVFIVGFRFRKIDSSDPQARRIDLSRAERLALQVVPQGRLGAEELRQTHGRLAWQIDVRLPHSSSLMEVEIDAIDGQVLATRIESEAEEEFEIAAQDSPINHSRPSSR